MKSLLAMAIIWTSVGVFGTIIYQRVQHDKQVIEQADWEQAHFKKNNKITMTETFLHGNVNYIGGE